VSVCIRAIVHQCNQWFRRCFPDCHLRCFPVKLKVTFSFPYMLKTAFKRRFCALLFFCLAAIAAAPQDAPSLPAAASEFAHLILSREGSPSQLSVTFQNLSSLPPETQEAMQNAIFNVFRGANVRLVKPEQSAVDVHITFSEDWQGYVWIANIQQGTGSQMVIKKLQRQQRAQASSNPLLTIRKIPVWQQDSPILDFYQDNQNLLVLEPGQLSLYASGGCGRRLAFLTRAHGRVMRADGWKCMAARSMRFFPARVAAEKFLLRLWIAAPVTIPGRSIRDWWHSSVRDEISSAVCWRGKTRERRLLRFSQAQRGRAATKGSGFLPAQTDAPAFFRTILQLQ
jgi:hypothetical protein